jgi:hypothetical protein
MNAKPTTRSKRYLALVLLGFVVLTCSLFYLTSKPEMDRTRPSAFAGEWHIVGIDGESRGTAVLGPDGSVNTHDDYTGIWIADDSAVHLVMWQKPPADSDRSFAASPDVQSLTIRQSPGDRIALAGAHVVLRRSSEKS